MAEYIEREKLLCSIGRNAKNFETAKDIEQAGLIVQLEPAADVVEVKHGYWHLLNNCANEGVYCSVCKKKVYKTNYANQKIKSPYCPNCGAKMDGGKNG